MAMSGLGSGAQPKGCAVSARFRRPARWRLVCPAECKEPPREALRLGARQHVAASFKGELAAEMRMHVTRRAFPVLDGLDGRAARLVSAIMPAGRKRVTLSGGAPVSSPARGAPVAAARFRPGALHP